MKVNDFEAQMVLMCLSKYLDSEDISELFEYDEGDVLCINSTCHEIVDAAIDLARDVAVYMEDYHKSEFDE